jgi:hypothetical protein
MENSSPWEKLIVKYFYSRKVWKSKGAEEPKFLILEDTGTQKDVINELGNSDTYSKYLWLTESSTLKHTLWCESNLTSAELDLWLAYNSSTEVAVATNPRSNMLLITWFEAALVEPAEKHIWSSES